MSAASFAYVRADSYEGAVAVLHEHGDEARVLAGGQSLVPMLNLRLARPSVLVDINALDGRDPSLLADGRICLPAMARHSRVMESSLVRAHCPLLATAIRNVGNVRVRNRGTIGGSLAHADPTGEISCVALTLGAEVVALGPGGKRSIPARELFSGYLTTVLGPDEVITETLMPPVRADQGWSFLEMVRRASDFAIVGIAATARLAEDRQTLLEAQVAMVGVASLPVMGAREPLDGLVGRVPTDSDIRAAARGLADATDPGDDVHATGDYRKRLVAVLGARALSEALARAGQGA